MREGLLEGDISYANSGAFYEVYDCLGKGDEVALHRVDMIVNDTVVIEIKATLELHKGARRQLRNYLRSTRLGVGLLFHFGPDPDFFRVVRRKPLPPATD